MARRKLVAIALALPTLVSPVAGHAAAAARIPTPARWGNEMYDASRAGWNPTETAVGPGNVARLSLAWSVPLGAATAYASPVVSRGLVFVGDDRDRLHAFRASTGEEVWSAAGESFYLDSGATGSSVVVAEAVYGPLHAYDARTGSPRWSVSCSGGFRAPPAIVRREVIASCFDGTIDALDLSTGALRWRATVDCCIFDQAPAVADGVVYQMSTGDTLTALDASTGTRMWSVPAFSVGPVAVADGMVFYNDYPDTVALDAVTGATVWRRSALTLQPDGSPAVANGVVYVQSGVLAALDERTGIPLWTAPSNSDQSPTVANDVVYTSSLTQDSTARWNTFDAVTGARLSTIGTPAGICVLGPCTNTIPVIAGGTLYLAGPGPQLEAFRVPRPVPAGP